MFRSRFARAYVLDPGERALATFVEQFVWCLIGTSSVSLVVTQDYVFAADAAAFAAVVSLITSVLTFWVEEQPPLVDLALRVLKTFLQSVLGTLLAGQVHTISGTQWAGAIAVAFPVAMTSALKGIAALALPWSHGASLLPAIHADAAVSATTLAYSPLGPPVTGPDPDVGEKDPETLGGTDPDATYNGSEWIAPPHVEATLAGDDVDTGRHSVQPDPVEAGAAPDLGAVGPQPN